MKKLTTFNGGLVTASIGRQFPAQLQISQTVMKVSLIMQVIGAQDFLRCRFEHVGFAGC